LALRATDEHPNVTASAIFVHTKSQFLKTQFSRRAALKTSAALLCTAAWPSRAMMPIKVQIVRAAIDSPVAQIHARGEQVWAITKAGKLWERVAGQWRLIATAPLIDPLTPMSFAHGRLVTRSASGALWMREGEGASAKYSVNDRAVIKPLCGLCPLAFAVIGVVVDSKGSAWLARFEPSARGWVEVARSEERVLPDARPIQVDLDGPVVNAQDGHIVVLAGPDDRRYRHGAVGDLVEATRLLYLERHSLKPLRTLTLDSPFVFEDIAPRLLDWPQQARGQSGLLTVRSGPQGSQLAVITANQRDSKAMTLAALGKPIGSSNRWIAATTDGQRIAGVHTPHIGGTLYAYQRVDEGGTTELKSTRLHMDLSTHVMASREMDLAVWSRGLVIMPSQDLRQLRVFAPNEAYDDRGIIDVPGMIVATAAMPASTAAKQGAVFALLRNGELIEVNW
jgi:hypothetical protein